MRSTPITLFFAVGVAACAKEKSGTVAGPPLTITPASAPATPTATTRSSAVNAEFVDLCEKTAATPPACEAQSKKLAFRACEQMTIAIVQGTGATALGETLGQGDTLIAIGAGGFELKAIAGRTRAVVATVQPPNCEPVAPGTPITKTVVRGTTAPELVWAGGQMRAHLDVGPEISPNAYVGRLQGSAPVAEHAHPDSWEIVCAVEAAGTFSLDGKEQRLAPGEIVRVPPGVKHAWTPDPGTKLVAVQFYSPPGPEQRFKALAAAAADAGSAKDAGKRP